MPTAGRARSCDNFKIVRTDRIFGSAFYSSIQSEDSANVVGLAGAVEWVVVMEANTKKRFIEKDKLDKRM